MPKTLLTWLGVTPGSEVWQASLHGHQKEATEFLTRNGDTSGCIALFSGTSSNFPCHSQPVSSVPAVQAFRRARRGHVVPGVSQKPPDTVGEFTKPAFLRRWQLREIRGSGQFWTIRQQYPTVFETLYGVGQKTPIWNHSPACLKPKPGRMIPGRVIIGTARLMLSWQEEDGVRDECSRVCRG